MAVDGFDLQPRVVGDAEFKMSSIGTFGYKRENVTSCLEPPYRRQPPHFIFLSWLSLSG
jgi:hypothetical protein